MWEDRDGAAVFGPERYRDTYLSVRPGVGDKLVLAFARDGAGIHGLDVAYIGARRKVNSCSSGGITAFLEGWCVCWCVVQLQSQAAEPSVKSVSVPNDKRRQGCRVREFGGSADSRADRAQKRLSLAGWGSKQPVRRLTPAPYIHIPKFTSVTPCQAVSNHCILSAFKTPSVL